MAKKIIMPKQGLQMTEGTIIKWLAAEGDSVKEGEPLFEMETDKLTITIDSTATGTLLKILRQESDVVPITETIAVVGEKGEDISEFLTEAKAESNTEPVKDAVFAQPDVAAETSAPAERTGGERVFATPRAKTTAEQKGIDINKIAGTGGEGLIIERDVLNAKTVKATPTANVIAAQNRVDLSSVSGSGVNGKIMKDDVLRHIRSKSATPEQNETIVPIKGIRKAIFDNMMTSLHSTAQANHRMKVDMSEATRLRNKYKDAGIKISFTDILVKTVSAALLRHPNVNSCVDGNNIVMKHYVNMGIAVAVPNGLIVPNIKNAEYLSLTEINEAVKALAAKARDGKLTPDEYKNGTFTITNLGMYDVDEFTAVINYPESAILAVGKITDTPVAINGAVEIRPILTLSLTYDHRIIDGAPAAEFLKEIKTFLENPYLLI